MSMGISRESWEQMVGEARRWAVTEGTSRAIDHVMYMFRSRFTDKIAEIDLILNLEHAINGPRPYPEFIPTLSVRRTAKGQPMRIAKIPDLVLPLPDRVGIHMDMAREYRNRKLNQPSGRIPGSSLVNLAAKINSRRI